MELGGVLAALDIGGSLETTFGVSETVDKSSITTKKDTYTINPRTNFWICQRVITLDAVDLKNAMQIFDSQLVVNGEMCG